MDLRERTQQLFGDVITRGDLTKVDALIHPTYSDPRGPSGRDGFVAGLQMVRGAFPDWSSTLEELIVEGDTVAARWTVRGTHQGPFMGIEPTGASIEMQECGFLSFEQGQLVEIRRVADELGLLRQLGVLPPAPA